MIVKQNWWNFNSVLLLSRSTNFRVHNVKEVKQGILVLKNNIKLMKNKYFGTDGIRGTVNQGNITEKNFLNLV